MTKTIYKSNRIVVYKRTQKDINFEGKDIVVFRIKIKNSDFDKGYTARFENPTQDALLVLAGYIDSLERKQLNYFIESCRDKGWINYLDFVWCGLGVEVG